MDPAMPELRGLWARSRGVAQQRRRDHPNTDLSGGAIAVPALGDAGGRQAAAVWGPPEGAEQTLRLVDVLRRAGAFAEAAALLPPLAKASDDATRLIAAFQQARIAAGDTGRHLMSSALRPPASKPHVAHGRSDVGFWGRLLGGRAR
jgi:hypothetical protein